MNDIVKHEFEAFLTSRLPEQAVDVVDGIVLDYLTSILQSLAEDDSTDIDDFIDMMNAYIPGFDGLHSDMVYAWLVDLATKLQNKKEQEIIPESSPNEEITSKALPINPKSIKRISMTKGESSSYTFVNSNDEVKPQDEKIPQNFSMAVESLCELFPRATQLEVRRCLMIANGDADEAARIMLMSRENCESCDSLVDSNPKPHHPSSKRQDINEEDQDKIKNNLVSRYGFVDVKSDSKTYQPSLLNKDDKKLVRYRDNLVVSTKGERFSMIKKQESEDEKKTYVNLKPARKYRFH